LTPEEVAAVADDLECLLRDEEGCALDTCLFSFPVDAVRPHVEETLAFTRTLAASGHGLIYVLDSRVAGE